MRYTIGTADWQGKPLPAVVNTETGITSSPMSRTIAERRCERLNRADAGQCVLVDSDVARWMRELHGIKEQVETHTHVVEAFSWSDPSYVFSTEKYDTLEAARAAFDRGSAHVRENGGGYRIRERASRKVLASFSCKASND
jgi:hypothetical protein